MRTSSLWCQRDEKGRPVHFANHPEVSRMYDPALPVHAARVTEAENKPDCYWAWWDQERGSFMFVYPARSLVEMCFHYGTRVEERRGKGHLLPVAIELGALVPLPPQPKKAPSVPTKTLREFDR